MAYPIHQSLRQWMFWAEQQKTVWWAGNDQCVALAETWIHNLGAPVIPCAYAWEIYGNAQAQYWEKIPNTPNLVPKPGDIAVWQEQIGSAGHVAVVRNGLSTVNYIYTIDQNWGRPRQVSFETHHYSAEHIEGFLRRK